MRDPYGGLMQSRDLRQISSLRDPVYRAKADILALDVTIDVGDSLTLTSQTIYNEDSVYSLQDFNRFNTQPVFNDSSNWYGWYGEGVDIQNNSPSPWRGLSPGGYYCDEQLGCSNTMVALDVSQAKGRQFGQEIRVASDYGGPINFSAGVNYIRFSTTIDYYVFNNVLSAYAGLGPFNAQGNRKLCDFAAIMPAYIPAVPSGDPAGGCPYIDPNPIDSINGEGQNYFRSKNPYRLTSQAAFGELYWQASEAIKVTAGLRYTDDRKSFTPVPSQALLGSGALTGGTVSRGYPVEPDIDQTWRELTGRLGIDWQPKLSFTDQTLLYAFYSHGYKGGGANPPGIGFAKVNPVFPTLPPVVSNPAVNYGSTFDPEFVDAFEVGSKNTLLGGAMTLNMTGFYYDYKGYQVSKIVDRTSVNENFDANVWGLELETLFRPSAHLRVNANVGYLNTRIADGEKSIDLMNRTQSNPDWTLVKPWVQLPSNCIVPTSIVEKYLDDGNGSIAGWFNFCGGWGLFGSALPYVDPATGQPYTPSAHPEINGGAGFYADLSGNELPNAPHWTISTGAQYDWDLFEGNWKLTVRGDAYWQSQSWARVYNDNPYDKLHGWYNVNLSMWIERPEDNLKIEIYAKNLLDKTPITDAFLNSDDSALTTNVFVLDPRLIGLSIKKGF
jgi:outer membrane receptor protein involved in Fe transport